MRSSARRRSPYEIARLIIQPDRRYAVLSVGMSCAQYSPRQNRFRQLHFNHRLRDAWCVLHRSTLHTSFHSPRHTLDHGHSLTRNWLHSRLQFSLLRRQHENPRFCTQQPMPYLILLEPGQDSNLVMSSFHKMARVMMSPSRHPRRVHSASRPINVHLARRVPTTAWVVRIPLHTVPTTRQARAVLHHRSTRGHLPRFHRASRQHRLVHHNRWPSRPVSRCRCHRCLCRPFARPPAAPLRAIEKSSFFHHSRQSRYRLLHSAFLQSLCHQRLSRRHSARHPLIPFVAFRRWFDLPLSNRAHTPLTQLILANRLFYSLQWNQRPTHIRHRFTCIQPGNSLSGQDLPRPLHRFDHHGIQRAFHARRVDSQQPHPHHLSFQIHFVVRRMRDRRRPGQQIQFCLCCAFLRNPQPIKFQSRILRQINHGPIFELDFRPSFFRHQRVPVLHHLPAIHRYPILPQFRLPVMPRRKFHLALCIVHPHHLRLAFFLRFCLLRIYRNARQTNY